MELAYLDVNHGASILGFEPTDGTLAGVLSSNQINIATFVYQLGSTHLPTRGQNIF